MRVEFESVGGPSLGDVETSNNQAVAVTTASSDLLQRIADTIGVTVDMLRDDPPTRADRSPATTAEVHALLDAFLALQETGARRRCIYLASAERAREN